MSVVYHKLVRDRIPEIIQSEGRRPVTRILDEVDYRKALLGKLVEEAQEASGASVGDLPGELADVLEVLRALTVTTGMPWPELLVLAEDKRSRRGGFGRGSSWKEWNEPAAPSATPHVLHQVLCPWLQGSRCQISSSHDAAQPRLTPINPAQRSAIWIRQSSSCRCRSTTSNPVAPRSSDLRGHVVQNELWLPMQLRDRTA